jgi:hypothetical protein
MARAQRKPTSAKSIFTFSTAFEEQHTQGKEAAQSYRKTAH